LVSGKGSKKLKKIQGKESHFVEILMDRLIKKIPDPQKECGSGETE
jgi:hypothetical protein